MNIVFSRFICNRLIFLSWTAISSSMVPSTGSYNRTIPLSNATSRCSFKFVHQIFVIWTRREFSFGTSISNSKAGLLSIDSSSLCSSALTDVSKILIFALCSTKGSLILANFLLSSDQATPRTGPRWENVCNRAPVSHCHNLTVASADAVNNWLEKRSMSKSHTVPLWP